MFNSLGCVHRRSCHLQIKSFISSFLSVSHNLHTCWISTMMLLGSVEEYVLAMFPILREHVQFFTIKYSSFVYVGPGCWPISFSFSLKKFFEHSLQSRLMVMNSFSFYLSERTIRSPLFLKVKFGAYWILFFFFQHLIFQSTLFLLAWREFCCSSYPCSTSGKSFFSADFFQDFVFGFLQFEYDMARCGIFRITAWCFWASCICVAWCLSLI